VAVKTKVSEEQGKATPRWQAAPTPDPYWRGRCCGGAHLMDERNRKQRICSSSLITKILALMFPQLEHGSCGGGARPPNRGSVKAKPVCCPTFETQSGPEALIWELEPVGGEDVDETRTERHPLDHRGIRRGVRGGVREPVRKLRTARKHPLATRIFFHACRFSRAERG
jgi:hypothetical protein